MIMTCLSAIAWNGQKVVLNGNPEHTLGYSSLTAIKRETKMEQFKRYTWSSTPTIGDSFWMTFVTMVTLVSCVYCIKVHMYAPPHHFSNNMFLDDYCHHGNTGILFTQHEHYNAPLSKSLQGQTAPKQIWQKTQRNVWRSPTFLLT